MFTLIGLLSPRFLIASAILVYCAIFPLLYFVGPDLNLYTKSEITYASIMYIVVFNTLMIIGVGYAVVGCVSYPYSNDFFNKTLKECDNTTTKACTITGSLLELLAIYQRSCTITEKAPTRHGDTMVNKR